MLSLTVSVAAASPAITLMSRLRICCCVPIVKGHHFHSSFPRCFKMDTDWTFSSCSWLWEEDITFKNACSGSSWTREEDKAFENALAVCFSASDCWDQIAAAVPGKTMEDLKLHYEALYEDVAAIESGKVPLPRYTNDSGFCKDEKGHPLSFGLRKGIPWTEEEHRQFLQGLLRFGKGDWKSISRHCVVTKTNSQVASHAQKYFRRLNSANKERKRTSINDITSVYPKSMSAQEKPITSNMPGDAMEQLTNVWNPSLPPAPISGMSSPPSSSPSIQEPGTSSVRMTTFLPPVQLNYDCPLTETMVSDMHLMPHY